MFSVYTTLLHLQTLTSYYEEQYDFHTYCVRKCFVAPYVSMLQFLDNVHNTPYYVKAAKVATKVYLTLHSNPDLVDDKPKADGNSSRSAEQRKLRRKANKQKAIEEKAQDEKAKQQQTSKKRNDLGDGEFVESAPLDPKKLLRTTTPLADATAFVQPLLFSECKDPELYELAFEIYERKEKVSRFLVLQVLLVCIIQLQILQVLLMLKCLKKLATLSTDHAKLKALQTRFNETCKRATCSTHKIARRNSLCKYSILQF